MTNLDTDNSLTPRRPAVVTRVPRAFTLIELMVSIALVLILILGVNTVFRIATTSIGAGNAISDVTRENRNVQAIIYDDFKNAVVRTPEMPAFVIRSTRQAAFLDQAEALGDRDYQALNGGGTRVAIDQAIRTRDLDDNNIEGEAAVPGETLSGYDLSARNHRLDVLGFFARYRYPRQTGNDGTYVAEMTGTEAYILYGHLRQPRDAMSVGGAELDPGFDAGAAGTPFTAQTNPNNFYARQWGLGRVAMILKVPDATTGQIVDDGGTPQFYIRRGGAAATSTAPLGAGASAYNGTTTDPNLYEWSRYDLAAASIGEIKTLLVGTVLPANAGTWFDGTNLGTRFAGYPLPSKPLTSYGAARTAPWLVSACTNFIVEYAGDFLHQAANGAVDGDWTTANVGTDGQIDWFLDVAGNRHIRWYGFPRDVAGVTVQTVNGPDGAVTPQGTASLPPSGSPDVLPLRDFLPTGSGAIVTVAGSASPGAAFEHFVGDAFAAANYNSTTPAVGSEYAAAWQPAGTYRNSGGAVVADPPKPSMIRITMTIDDPNSRLPDGQTYEYVITLP
jgi:prepilin-type N-terminal cleavage/methylation domain-containing protein